MAFFRTAARCASRSLRIAQVPASARTQLPITSIATRASLLRPTSRLFSAGAYRFESEGQVNAELAGKLSQELTLEREMRDPNALPDHLKEFIDNTPFKLVDQAGSEEVSLTRTFGDEKVTVRFSVDDLNNPEEDVDQLQDDSLEDEEFESLPSDTQSGGASSKGAINQGKTSAGNFKVAPEDSIDEHEQSDESGMNEPGFPAHLLITVERGSKGALQFEAIAQDGLIVIDQVYYYKDASLLEPDTTTKERAAGRLYTGPPFNNLDEDLQVLFENYLAERGINTTMALFVPEYIDFKEQKEYMSWLEGVKDFVE